MFQSLYFLPEACRERKHLLYCPGMSISIVTKLQLEFHLDLVKKKFFCAIGGFKDVAALVSW